MAIGNWIGYTTTALPQLQNEIITHKDVILNEKMGSWFASIGFIIGIFINPLGGWLGGYFGRKKIIQLTVPFAIVGWIILGTAENRISLFSGRIITSIALMCQMSAPCKTHKI